LSLILSVAASAAARRVIVFRTAGFPTVDAPPISDITLDRALRGFPVDTLDDLQKLPPSTDAVLLLPYGSAFPLEAWPQLRDFIKRGGGLVILGGAPLHQPVLRAADGTWQLGTRQPTFAHELLIGPAEEVSVRGLRSVDADPTWTSPMEGASRVWESTVRLSTHANTANEQGAEGDREGVVRPLVHLVDSSGVPRACPLLAIDRMRGDGAGARWIFAPSDASLSADAIHQIIERALEGAVDIDARPVRACVGPGEAPVVRITAPGTKATLFVRDEAGAEVHHGSTVLPATYEIHAKQPLTPGLYHVEIATNSTKHPNVVRTAFWVRDSALLARGPKVTVSRDWIRRDGRVFPVIGTTYMASDVHRQFLFEPNPEVWDRDFAQMERLGINFVRTGLWTGWSRAANDQGEVDENVLRALEAYVLTAAKHDIIVCFTFFAFLPPAYGGTNPYLDPASLAGQTRFVTSIAKRFRGSGWIHYDLINEPSYAPPEGLWSNRPIHDEWEKRAWIEWVHGHYGDDMTRIRDAWQDPGDSMLDVPADWEVWPAQVRESRRPRKVFDFVLFTNDIVARWADRLRTAIREAGGDPLVTLGQDEGGTGTRPSQQLHDVAVDYTSVHPWWNNDDVVSTGTFAKVPEKPLLFQETGLMRLEDASGFPWRSPDAAASLLERKYAYGFASRAAGVVEWAWNINPYMPIDNESTIGFFRPDGTAKPELDVVPRFARFFREAAPWLDDFGPDQVVVIIPQSRLFMNRPNAIDGFRRLVRTLGERFGVGATAISDLRVTAERLKEARLVIVPSVEFLTAEAADLLAHAPGRVLYLGATVIQAARPVRLREEIGGRYVTFDRNLQESLLRSTRERDDWHEPLPLEFAREDEPLVALLGRALRDAGVATHATKPCELVRVLEGPRATMTVSVNDGSGEVVLILTDRATNRVLTSSSNRAAAASLPPRSHTPSD